jgi:predicted nucleic acid-binding protein
LRLTLDDQPAQAAAGRSLFERVGVGELQLVLHPHTVSEFLFVLTGPRLGHTPLQAAEALRAVLALPLVVRDRPIIERAADLMVTSNPDWDDCLLAAYAMEHTGGRVASFDRGFDAIPGLQRLEPVP